MRVADESGVDTMVGNHEEPMAGSDALAGLGHLAIEHCPNGRAPESVVFLRGGRSMAGRRFRLREAWADSRAEGPVTAEPDGDATVLQPFVHQVALSRNL